MTLITFQFIIFYKTALHHAILKRNIEIVRLLTEYKNTDVNIRYIQNYFFSIQFSKYFYFKYN